MSDPVVWCLAIALCGRNRNPGSRCHASPNRLPLSKRINPLAHQAAGSACGVVASQFHAGRGAPRGGVLEGRQDGSQGSRYSAHPWIRYRYRTFAPRQRCGEPPRSSTGLPCFPQCFREPRIPAPLPGREGLLFCLPGVVPRSRDTPGYLPRIPPGWRGNAACKEQRLFRTPEFGRSRNLHGPALQPAGGVSPGFSTGVMCLPKAIMMPTMNTRVRPSRPKTLKLTHTACEQV